MRYYKLKLLFILILQFCISNIGYCQEIKKEQIVGKWKLRVYDLKTSQGDLYIDQNNLDSSFNDFKIKMLQKMNRSTLSEDSTKMLKQFFLEHAKFISQCYINLYKNGKCKLNIIENDKLLNKEHTYKIEKDRLQISDGSNYKILSVGKELKLLSSSGKLTLTYIEN